jgi:hypothetical protein
VFQLKPLSKAAVGAALTKAERYRLLNEPWQAESICRDVLAIDPDNQEALVTLLLALTDQFDQGSSDLNEARELAGRLAGKYQRAYYAGIVCERQGVALCRKNRPGASSASYEWISQAMDWYEQAELIRPPGNDDAPLRWNTCVRFLVRHPDLVPSAEGEVSEPLLLE